MDLDVARELLAGQLGAVGIRAVTEPRSVLAPCALVDFPSHVALPALGGDSAVCDLVVTLIAPANDPRWLLTHLVTAMVAIGSTESDSFLFSLGPDADLPAYQMSVTVTAKEHP